MVYPLPTLCLLIVALIHLTRGHGQEPIALTLPSHSTSSSDNDVMPLATRIYWMRRANAILAELASPCPYAPFGTVIVNHSDTSDGPLGREICCAVNGNMRFGNPTLHGEISGINNCSAVLTDPKGDFRLNPEEALDALKDLSLYTNAEPCPMCASAIRWSGFAECIYGTSIKTLISKGWHQITLSAEDLFAETAALSGKTRLVKDVLANETDPYFSWQNDEAYPCPVGCERSANGKVCTAVR